MLSNRLFCECGAKMVGDANGQNRPAAYRCTGTQCTHSRRRVMQESTEKIITEVMIHKYFINADPAEVARIVEEHDKTANTETAEGIKKSKKAIDALEIKISGLIDLAIDPEMRSAAKKKIVEAQKEQQMHERKLAALEATIRKNDEISNVEYVTMVFERAIKAYKENDRNFLKQLVVLLIEKIISTYDGRFIVTWGDGATDTITPPPPERGPDRKNLRKNKSKAGTKISGSTLVDPIYWTQ